MATARKSDLREHRLIMPFNPANEGSNEAHLRLKQELVAAFGGFTETIGRGGWKGANGIVYDDVAVYDVAFDVRSEADWLRFVAIGMEIGALLGQEAVYFRNSYGEVLIKDIAAVLETAATVIVKLPKPNQLWRMRCGGAAAVLDDLELSSLPQLGGTDRPLRCIVLSPGDTAVNKGWVFNVNRDGTVLRGAEAGEHALDLIKFIADFT